MNADIDDVGMISAQVYFNGVLTFNAVFADEERGLVFRNNYDGTYSREKKH